jgi:hypothetical protein
LVDGPIELFLGGVFGKKIAAYGGRIAATDRHDTIRAPIHGRFPSACLPTNA